MRPTFKDVETLDQLGKTGKIEEYIAFREKFDWSTELTGVDDKYGLKNCFGEQIVPNDFEDFKVLNGTVMKDESRVVTKKGGKWGILKTDGSGEWILKPEYDFISYPNSILAVRNGDKWGIMNIEKNEFIVPLEQDYVYTPLGILFENGICVFMKNEKYGFMNEFGEKTDAIFEEVDYLDGIVKVLYNRKWGFVDENSQFTEDEDEAYFFSNI